MDFPTKEPFQKSPIKHRRKILSLIVLVSIVLTLLSFFWLRAEEQQFIQTDFNRVAEGRLASLELALEQKFLKLRSLAVVHQSLGKIERKSFPEVIQRLNLDVERIRSIGWIPKVLSENRQMFEKHMQAETGKHFHFYQRGAEGFNFRTSIR